MRTNLHRLNRSSLPPRGVSASRGMPPSRGVSQRPASGGMPPSIGVSQRPASRGMPPSRDVSQRRASGGMPNLSRANRGGHTSSTFDSDTSHSQGMTFIIIIMQRC